jgi:transposase
MSSSKPRRSFTADQKAAILRRHLVDKVAVSDLCDEYKIQPSLFYLWQRQLMENLSSALENGGRSRKSDHREQELRKRLAELEAKVTKKDGVIAELMEEYVALKKKLGEL